MTLLSIYISINSQLDIKVIESLKTESNLNYKDSTCFNNYNIFHCTPLHHYCQTSQIDINIVNILKTPENINMKATFCQFDYFDDLSGDSLCTQLMLYIYFHKSNLDSVILLSLMDKMDLYNICELEYQYSDYKYNVWYILNSLDISNDLQYKLEELYLEDKRIRSNRGIKSCLIM